MPKYLDPKGDFLFGVIFYQAPYRLMSLLNALLPLPKGVEIKELEYLSKKDIPENRFKHHSLIIVRCTDSNGRSFIVELLSYWTIFIALFNTICKTATCATRIKKGESFTNPTDVYTLCFENYKYFDYGSGYEYIHEYRITDPNMLKNGCVSQTLIVVELPKFNPEIKADRPKKKLWMKFLTQINEQTKDVAPELLKEEEIRQALAITEMTNYSDNEIKEYYHYAFNFWEEIMVEYFSKCVERYEESKKNG